jgi:drug/metabolite transporter (DMT)-like permease
MPSSLLFILASLIWGSTFWAITQQLGNVPPAVSVAYRFGLAAVALFLWCLLRGDRLRLPWRLQRWLMLQGFFSFTLSYICTYSSEQYLVSALVAVLFALMVIWSPLLERVLYGTPLTWRIWAAALLAIGGVLLLFFPALRASWANHIDLQSSHFLFGLVLALVATLSSTAGNLCVAQIRRHSDNVLLTMAWAMTWGTLWVSSWVVASGQQWVVPTTLSYWLAMLYLALFGSVIAFACYFTLIHRIGAQKAVYIGVITPIISVLLSIKLENYHPGYIEWLGMGLCLAGVAWALRGNSPTPAPTLKPLINPTKHAEPS